MWLASGDNRRVSPNFACCVTVWKRDARVVYLITDAGRSKKELVCIVLFVMKLKRWFLCFAFVAALALLYILFGKQSPDERILQGKGSTTGHQTWSDGPTDEHKPTEQQRKHVYQYVAPGNSSVVGKVFQMDKETTLLDFLA